LRRVVFTIILLMGMFMGTVAPGWCGGDISLKARPGLAGIYKVNHLVPIRVDIENRGEGIQGQLVVMPRLIETAGAPSMRNAPVYRSLVDIPAGGKSAIHMVVPGEIAAGAESVRLISGERVLAETKLEGSAVAGGIVIIPLSEKVSGSSLFMWMDKKYGGQVTVKYLPAGELPGKALFLEGADIMVVDREAAAQLNENQIKALKDWVVLGGSLLLSGEEGVTEGPFRDIVPDTKEGVLRKVLGRGAVILSRTPLENINDPDGKTWESMGLSPIGLGTANIKEIDMKNMEAGMMSEMGSYFPMIKIPDISVLIILWILYTLTIGPGAYLVLKRYNRRDLCWLIIPALSLAAGLALFFISPVNRLNAYLAHTMSTVEIVHPNLAEVKTAGTIVLPKGGKLEVRGSGEVLLQPANIYGSRLPAWVFSGNESRIIFNYVEYGSMRQVSAYGTLAGLGMVEGSVYFRDDRVMGEIVNKTPFNLRDCRLLVGSALVELGQIPAGSGKEIDEPLNRSQLVTDPNDLYRTDPRAPVKARETRLIADFTVRREASGEIYFLGWSDSPADNIHVVSSTGQGQASGLTMVRQKMEPLFPPGPFKLPASLIKNTITGIDGGYSWRPDGLNVHRGSVKITYDLNKTLGKDFRLTGIELPLASDKTNYIVEIFRQDLSQWEHMTGGQKVSSDVSKYLSGKGIIDVKITSQVEKPGIEGAFRGITVEGVIGE